MKIIEAFSKAKEYCEVGLWVKASNLGQWDSISSARTVGLVSTTTTDAPCKGYFDMLLVYREAQVEQLELAIVSVEKVPSSRAVLAGTPHVLPQAVQSGALFRISLWVVAISVLYVVFQRVYPVDLVGCLERHRYHGHLGHLGCGVGVVGCVIPKSQVELDQLLCGRASVQPRFMLW